MSYPFEDLDDAQFERLVVQVMRKLFGAGVQSFATGPDGGRDARFHGTAERFPSQREPWTGITVGQAKHTNAINAHYGDRSFSGDSESSTISEELKRIKKLASAGEADNYILFSNRRLGGVVAPTITRRISEFAGIPPESVYLAGIEYLDDMLHEHPDLLRLAKIDPLDGPLLVSSYDLAEVILAMATQLSAPISPQDAPLVDRVEYDEKNRINGMSPAFAEEISGRYMSYTQQIDTFLANPGNREAVLRYTGAVEEFQLKILAHRQQHQSFDTLFNYLFDLLVGRDGILARNRTTTRALLFYMYWHCDIGETPDAETR